MAEFGHFNAHYVPEAPTPGGPTAVGAERRGIDQSLGQRFDARFCRLDEIEPPVEAVVVVAEESASVRRHGKGLLLLHGRGQRLSAPGAVVQFDPTCAASQTPTGPCDCGFVRGEFARSQHFEFRNGKRARWRRGAIEIVQHGAGKVEPEFDVAIGHCSRRSAYATRVDDAQSGLRMGGAGRHREVVAACIKVKGCKRYRMAA